MSNFNWIEYSTNNYHKTSKECQDCGKHISLSEYLNASDYMYDNEVLCDKCYDEYVQECSIYHSNIL